MDGALRTEKGGGGRHAVQCSQIAENPNLGIRRLVEAEKKGGTLQRAIFPPSSRVKFSRPAHRVDQESCPWGDGFPNFHTICPRVGPVEPAPYMHDFHALVVGRDDNRELAPLAELPIEETFH